MVHERRRFTDVMDEEIDDERKRTALDRYTAGFVRSRMETCSLDLPRRVKQEVTSRLSIYDDVVALREGAHYGTAPFFREKPDTCAIVDGCPLTLTCVFTGDPEPIVQWFKNDIILKEDARVYTSTVNGRSTLTFKESHDYDVGMYKIVARNTLGQVTHRCRLVQGHIPGVCDSPDVPERSDNEVLVCWRPPADDGGSQILCYHLQMKSKGDTEWLTVTDNIDHEFFMVKGLAEDSMYQFRVAAKNFLGWGEFSVGTQPTRTATGGAPKIRMTREMQMLQHATESGKVISPFLEKKDIDYRKETDPVRLKSGENAQLQVRKYDMVAELGRGSFSVTAKCIRTDDRRHFAAKLLENYNRQEIVKEEYEMFKTLRHERLAQLYEAYNAGEVTVFIMELLAGVDVLSYLASKREYSEQHVVTITMQVLDALSYLHWRGMCHLDIQPDNIVLTTTRRCDIKLVDFGSTQRVSKRGSTVPVNGHIDFIAPEVLLQQTAFPTSDIWSLGVLVYLLLSGKSAFAGEDDEETQQNISSVRYRYEHLGSNTTQEAIRFLMLIFKRDPSKRPTVEDCREHKWLAENDYIVKKRERATFLGNQLREFDTAYHKERAIAATKSLRLLTFGGKEMPAAIAYEPDVHVV